MDIPNFERAFDTGTGSCVRTCACGRVFYNPDSDWDFAQGELKELQENPDATWLDYAVTSVSFEGTEYVTDCKCWHERAEKIMGFIDGHAYKIAEYLTLEKERKTIDAEISPIVGGKG
jgi:hypothetical protein